MASASRRRARVWIRPTAALQKYQRGAVVVIEDEAQARAMVRRALTKPGWQMREAENGRVAFKKLNGTGPAAILLYLMMPEMDGLEFMEASRQRDDGKAVPVIVVTAKDLTEEDGRRLSGGVEHILQKGANSQPEVLETVRSITQRSIGETI